MSYFRMDIKAYISSGILENYVLGSVSDQERQEVERYMQKYPEIRMELVAIEDALGQYAQTKARPMPQGLDQQILSHFNELAKSDKGSNTPNTTTIQPKSDTTQKSSSSGWLSGLLGLLSLLGIGAAVYFGSQASTLRSDITTKDQQLINQQLACDEVQQQRQDLEQQLNILRDDAYRSILLKGTDKAPDAVAAIYYNEANQKTYLDIRSLPTPASDKQYQLWAIVDGAPVDMGVFDIPVDTVDFVEVPHILHAQAFAVTLEPKGGVESPTLEEMYVIGNT